MWLEAARTGTAASRAPPVPPPGGAAVSSAHTLGIPPPTYKKTVPGTGNGLFYFTEHSALLALEPEGKHLLLQGLEELIDLFPGGLSGQ